MSPKQIAANQANARKSTGPKTPEGRAVSKMNALKHGILSREKILRNETKLERQMFRTRAQLERLQRMRKGEAVPVPLSVEISKRA